MAIIVETFIVQTTASSGIIHNNLSGLNEGDYKHLTQSEYDAIGATAGLRKIEILNGEAEPLNVTGTNGFCEIMVGDNAGYAYLRFATNASFNRLNDTGFEFLKNTPDSVNIYTETNDIVIQNLSGLAVEITYDLRKI